MLDLTLPHDLTEHEREAILAHFNAIPLDSRIITCVFELCLPDRPLFLIKYGWHVIDEAYTQHFFYCLLRNDPQAPHIPRVFDAFSADGLSFLVMQKIIAPTLKDARITEEEAVGHAAHAIKWLFDQTPSVPASIFGHISPNAPVCHTFFKDQRAPRVFDPEMLLKYIEKAFRRRPGGQFDPALRAQLEAAFKTRSICHSDIHPENFLLDVNKKVWIIDFQHVSVLPPVFQTFAFFNSGGKFGSAVGKHLGYQPSAISEELVKAAWLLQQVGGNAAMGF